MRGARTPEGREMEQFTYLWVSGAGESDFGEGNRKTVQLIPDKKTYRCGETAKVLIVTDCKVSPSPTARKKRLSPPTGRSSSRRASSGITISTPNFCA